MGSNGLCLGDEKLRQLKEAGLKGLGISVDSVEARGHDRFRGMEGSWEKAIRALQAAKALGLETQMDVTLTDENIEEMDGLIELAAALSAKAVSFFFLVCTGRAMKTKISGFNYEGALKRIARVSQTEKRLMVKARCAPHIYRLLSEQGCSLPQGTRGCLAGKHYLRVDHQGNVTPCPYLPGSLGNVREVPLTTLWNEAASLRQLRQGNYRGRCGVCEHAEICGGCRARALAEMGDLLEEDPLCTYQPPGKTGDRGRRVQSSPSSESKALHSELKWDDRALERIQKVPPFMKGMIVRMIEARAKEKGMDLVTSEFIGEMKARSGIHGPREG